MHRILISATLLFFAADLQASPVFASPTWSGFTSLGVNGSNTINDYFIADLELINNPPRQPVVLDRLVGDANIDGVVDLQDLNEVRNSFGSSANFAGGHAFFRLFGDTDGDSKVDLQDLNNVRNNFGATRAVPEPSSLVLLFVGLLAWRVAKRKAA